MQLIKENSYILKRSVPAISLYMLWYVGITLSGDAATVKVLSLPFGFTFLFTLVHGAVLGLVGGIISAFFLKNMLGNQSTEYITLSRRLLLSALVFGISFLAMWWLHTKLSSFYSSLTFALTRQYFFDLNDGIWNVEQANWYLSLYLHYIPISRVAIILSIIAFFYLRHFHSGYFQTEEGEYSSSSAKGQPKAIIHMAIWGMTGLYFFHFWLSRFLKSIFLPDVSQDLVPVNHINGLIFFGGWGVILGVILWRFMTSYLARDDDESLNTRKIYFVILIATFLVDVLPLVQNVFVLTVLNIGREEPLEIDLRLLLVIYITTFLWAVPTYHYLSRFNKWWLWKRPRKKVDS